MDQQLKLVVSTRECPVIRLCIIGTCNAFVMDQFQLVVSVRECSGIRSCNIGTYVAFVMAALVANQIPGQTDVAQFIHRQPMLIIAAYSVFYLLIMVACFYSFPLICPDQRPICKVTPGLTSVQPCFRHGTQSSTETVTYGSRQQY